MINKFKDWVKDMVSNQIKESYELNKVMADIKESQIKIEEHQSVYRLYIHFNNGKVEWIENTQSIESFSDFSNWFENLKRETYRFEYNVGYKIYKRSEINYIHVCEEKVRK